MAELSLYEQVFEGKQLHTCENCIYDDACHEFSGVVPQNDNGDCELWEDKNDVSLYDVMFEKED